MALFLALLIPTITGLVATAWFVKDDESFCFFERLFYGYALGIGLASFTLFFFGLVGIPFSAVGVTVVLALVCAVFFWLIHRSDTSFSRALFAGGVGTILGRYRGILLVISIAMLAWIALKCYFVISGNLMRPVFSWDAFTNWSAGAKLFYYEGSLLLDRASPNFFGTGYREFLGHPLLTPLAEVYVALWVGSFDERLVDIWSAFFYISLLGSFYLALRRDTSPLYALVWVLLLSSAPLLTFHALDAYSDLPLACYLLLGTVLFWRYLATGDRKLALLSGLFIGMAVFTKNEGFVFFIALGAAYLIAAYSEKKPILSFNTPFFLGFLALALPWIIFKVSLGLGFGHTGSGGELAWLSDPKYTGSEARGIHWEIIGVSLSELFLKRPNFNLILPFWLITGVLGIRIILRSNLKYLHMLILLIVAAFVFVYLTLEVTAVTQATGLHRNFMTFIPLIFFAAALVFRALLRENSPQKGDSPID